MALKHVKMHLIGKQYIHISVHDKLGVTKLIEIYT